MIKYYVDKPDFRKLIDANKLILPHPKTYKILHCVWIKGKGIFCSVKTDQTWKQHVYFNWGTRDSAAHFLVKECMENEQSFGYHFRGRRQKTYLIKEVFRARKGREKECCPGYRRHRGGEIGRLDNLRANLSEGGGMMGTSERQSTILFLIRGTLEGWTQRKSCGFIHSSTLHSINSGEHPGMNDIWLVPLPEKQWHIFIMVGQGLWWMEVQGHTRVDRTC